MRFHQWQTLYSACRALRLRGADRMDWRAWYRETWPAAPDRIVQAELAAESDWLADGRPYYSVWPVAIEPLVRLRLDLDSGLIHLPLPVLLVRFAEGHELDTLGDGSHLARGVLACRATVHSGEPGVLLFVDFGERRGGIPIYSYRCFRLRPAMTVEASLADIDMHYAGADPEEAVMPVVRLVCSLCLLGDDPDLIEPDVLAADRAKYERTGDAACVARAVRRGKRGWNVGARLEVSPHYRRPHFGIRWTGKGRSVPRVVPIKGCIVKRRKLTQIPTGRLDRP